MLDVGPFDNGTTEQFELSIGQLRESRSVVEWHVEPNVSVQRPAQAGEARRSGSAATDGWASLLDR